MLNPFESLSLFEYFCVEDFGISLDIEMQFNVITSDLLLDLLFSCHSCVIHGQFEALLHFKFLKNLIILMWNQNSKYLR